MSIGDLEYIEKTREWVLNFFVWVWKKVWKKSGIFFHKCCGNPGNMSCHRYLPDSVRCWGPFPYVLYDHFFPTAQAHTRNRQPDPTGNHTITSSSLSFHFLYSVILTEYVRIEPRMSVCVSVCVYVCVYVCVSATAQTAGPILTKIHTNPL